MLLIQKIFIEVSKLISFQLKKQEAILAWKVTGKRHWVVPIRGSRHMVVLNSDQLAVYNKKARKYHAETMDINWLIRNAYYGTPVGSTLNRKRNG